MTLTTLRRLVLAGNAAALLAAGAAAWHSLQVDSSPRDPKEWQKLFPVKTRSDALETKSPGGLDLYVGAATWPQGEKPLPKTEEKPEDRAPPPDPFKTKYTLCTVFSAEGGNPFDSFAQLRMKGDERPFSVRVGDLIPTDPWLWNSPPTEWRLNDVFVAKAPDKDRNSPGRQVQAIFRHVSKDEVQILESSVILPRDLPSALDIREGTLPGQEEGVAGRPSKDQPIRIRLVSEDKDTGDVTWEVADGEVEWLGFYADDEVAQISAVPSKDAAGNPDGFTLKAVPRGSRAAQMGFIAEDKVIAVNGTPVSSTENAISVGKQQYEGGKSTFVVKVLRAGRERNYTFKATKKQ